MTYTPAYSYDPTATDPTLAAISLLRLRLGDTDFSSIQTPPLSVMFADQELTAILNADQNDQIFALCDCLLSIANNAARLNVFVTLQGGGSIDRRQIASALLAQSKEIREQYINTPAFALIEMDYNSFSAREIVWNAIQREVQAG